MNVRAILARYGVKPGTLPLEGDATPLAEALEAYVSSRYDEARLAGKTDADEEVLDLRADLLDLIASMRTLGEATAKRINHEVDRVFGAAPRCGGKLIPVSGAPAIPCCLPATHDGLCDFSDVKDARAPDLADWVTAACRSKLGEPAWFDGDGGLGMEWRGRFLSACIMTGTDGIVAVVWHGEEGERFTSPAELRTALDALAGGAS